MDHKLRRQYVVTRDKKDIIAIAHEIYGSGGMAGRILRENPGVFQLKAGMVLNLPEDVPQRTTAPDQAMRLDFAGLRDTLQLEIKREIENDNEVEIALPKEQFARELIGLLEESGLLELAVESLSEAQDPIQAPEKDGAGKSEEESMDTLEVQVDIEVQEDDSSV